MKVYLKISPMKEVVTFVKKAMYCSHSVGHYEIIKNISKVAYEFWLPSQFASVYLVFHVSMCHDRNIDPKQDQRR